jgi:hypothetical protein
MQKIIKRLRMDKALIYRIEKYFWVAMIAPTVLWLRDSVLWVSLLSIYALVITAAGAEQAAEAAAEAKNNGE